MPIHTIRLTTPLRRSFRTEQVAGLFDLALDDLAEERFAHTLTAELPDTGDDWTIGAIVGPSGSGKTTLARAAYGAALHEPKPWPENEALIDALESVAKAPTSGRGVEPFDCHSRLTMDDGEHCSPNTLTNGQGFESAHLPLKHLLRVLAAVGLASPPSWLKPYRVLSTGERFRADLALAILQHSENLTQRRGGAEEADGGTPNLCAPAPLRETIPLLVFDEFTSTLDRTVACTASHALAKFLRGQQGSEVRVQGSGANKSPSSLNPERRTLNPFNPKFIALSCHTDFLPWLAPDWILDLGEGERERGREGERETNVRTSTSILPLSHSPSLPLIFRPHWPRGSLQRPELRLRVARVPQKLWPRFARHHYLSGGLATAATCYAAFVQDKALTSGQGDLRFDTGVQPSADEAIDHSPNTPTTGRGFERPIAFCAVLATLGWKRTKRITRLVVLPEFQGLGIGSRLAETVATAEVAKGNRVTITASHPSVLAWCSRSPRWKYLGLKKTGSTRQQLGQRTIRCSTGRAVASFEFLPAD